jgi:NAD(P)H-flavin reductase
VLIYGNRTEGDIVFYADFLQMEAGNEKLRVVYTLTDPSDNPAWNGRMGPIDSEMVRNEIPDHHDRVFYICGPPKMVDSLRSLLLDELQLQKERIKWEHFLGYD